VRVADVLQLWGYPIYHRAWAERFGDDAREAWRRAPSGVVLARMAWDANVPKRHVLFALYEALRQLPLPLNPAPPAPVHPAAVAADWLREVRAWCTGEGPAQPIASEAEPYLTGARGTPAMVPYATLRVAITGRARALYQNPALMVATRALNTRAATVRGAGDADDWLAHVMRDVLRWDGPASLTDAGRVALDRVLEEQGPGAVAGLRRRRAGEHREDAVLLVRGPTQPETAAQLRAAGFVPTFDGWAFVPAVGPRIQRAFDTAG
jgi:hypothetical protein